MKQTTEAIILRRVNFSEADRILTLLTPEKGKIRAIAKGVRKEKSKLAGGLELLSISTVGYIKGKGDLDQIVSTRLNKHFENIVSDYDRVQLAYKTIEWVDTLTEDDSNEDYYSFLVDAFESLNDVTLELDLLESWLRLKILLIHGHLPNLTHDCTGAQLEEGKRYTFDTYDGCFKPADKGQFDSSVIKVWRVLVNADPKTARKVKGLSENIGESPDFLGRFMQNQLHVS